VTSHPSAHVRQYAQECRRKAVDCTGMSALPALPVTAPASAAAVTPVRVRAGSVVDAKALRARLLTRHPPWRSR
jgi:hypothetical protein